METFWSELYKYQFMENIRGTHDEKTVFALVLISLIGILTGCLLMEDNKADK